MGRLSRTFFQFLALALVAILLASGTTDAQDAELLATKVTKLRVKAEKTKGTIELDANAFDQAMAKPRNYSMVVLFTAMSPEFQCVPCKNFDPEYRLVAAGWSKIPDKSQLFFGVLDFKEGQSIFQKFNMNSAPSVLYFPATDSLASVPPFDRYDFGKSGFQAEAFAGWLGARSGIQLKVQRPFDFVDFALKVLGVIGLVASVHIIYSRAGKIIRSKYLWAALSLFTIFVMISGHMWNQIRHPPYTMPGRDGRPGFIAAGFQNQFGLETQIVAIMYAVLCGGVISLISSVPRIENPAKQRIAVWIWMAVIGIMFSILIQFFRLKNPSYPFRLLL
ncbi:oligosaccharyl transferase subunit ost3/OST6 [Mortierella polycephala]|uniref:Oligosaccharyl transferase subunit ost3/OST6 n=1 Tax=Mortierella polycephala TaxID=41804 RepID=A0A9P6Q7Z9_9FUNG|nr:oligosaccharyl transferase subunit ost3/OST6 [Mortierella polycephala]